jgi:hypothetical protein
MKGTIVRVLVAIVALGTICGVALSSQARAQTRTYSAMAPLGDYLMPARSEIALARSAAPRSVSERAEVMVLGRSGYAVAVKGTNGFLCIVERSWANATGDPGFWNPRMRAPVCFNPPAARTFAPIYLLKTRLVLEGRSKAQILRATAAGFATGQLPQLAPGAMAYMMSREQYLGDAVRNWHPHLMFYVPGDAVASWGANLPASPVLAARDPQERVTTFFVWVGNWSDGTAAPKTSR